MTGAERMRLARARARDGYAVLSVEVHADRLAELLVAAKFLDGNLADDREKLAAATSAYLAEMADYDRDASRQAKMKAAIVGPNRGNET